MNEIKNTIKIVLLDMDGVINSDDFIDQWILVHGDSKESMEEFKQRYFLHNGQDGYVVPELLERFKRICNETGCKIVWSSSWRENYWRMNRDTGEPEFDWHGIATLWKAKGLPVERLIGCTPCLDKSRFSYVPRGIEIQRWIDENAERYNIGRVAILDDNEDAWSGVENENARFFNTTFQHGLTESLAQNVIDFLNGE